MQATVKAAQIDPRRADHTLTPGAKSSVLLVEQALRAKHLLDAQWVDGYFGTTTVAAYTRYQQSLGYTGLDANGLPGRTSLTKLGAGRFTVTNVIGPGTRVDIGGGGIIINTRTQSRLSPATARVRNSSTASPGPPSSAWTDNPGTENTRSKGTSNLARLVASTADRGLPASSRSSNTTTPSSRCSQLSSDAG